MSILTIEIEIPKALDIEINSDSLTVNLSDGRTIVVPTSWFPRLSYSTQTERDNWQLIGDGQGIHWPGMDEDISVEGLIAGKPSSESQKSLKKWLSDRNKDRGRTPNHS